MSRKLPSDPFGSTRTTIPTTCPPYPTRTPPIPKAKRRGRGDKSSKKRLSKLLGGQTGTDTDEEGPGMSSRAAMMQDSEQGDKSWFQRQKDKLADKKERRAKRKAEERKQRAEQEKQIRVGLLPTIHGSKTDGSRLKSRRTGRSERNSSGVSMPLWVAPALRDTPLHPWHTDPH
jgi:hypothetical protein